MFAPIDVFDQAQDALEHKKDADYNDLIAAQTLPFYNFLLTTLFNLNRSVDAQILLRNVIADFKGMSKSGRIMFSKMGLLLSERTFQRRLAELDAANIAAITYVAFSCI